MNTWQGMVPVHVSSQPVNTDPIAGGDSGRSVLFSAGRRPQPRAIEALSALRKRPGRLRQPAGVAGQAIRHDHRSRLRHGGGLLAVSGKRFGNKSETAQAKRWEQHLTRGRPTSMARCAVA
jgi:hypothetical protein